LLGQLEEADALQAHRGRLWSQYASELLVWAEKMGVRLPQVPADCTQPFHMFQLLCSSLEQRTAFIDHLRAAGILAVFHYLPLHLSPMGRRYGGAPGDCPVTESISDRLVRLPLFNSMTDDEQEQVIDRALSFSW
jgi:dTDP-4-amino-4,6-dideoxygalactose transaminase